MRLPECPFYLFGMGDRRKLLYKAGALLDLFTGEVVRQWDTARDHIFASEYAVRLRRADGGVVLIVEDEHGLWVEEEGRRTALAESRLSLPRFEEHSHGALLRTLHHDILVSIADGKPVPNILVYPKPWYRDAAMTCLCLEKTGNLHLVRDWVLGLRQPFDGNNRCQEPDNLGQGLYLVSLFSDRSHPLVKAIQDTIPQCRQGDTIVGITDGAEHPVYQTKWLKYGLRRLGLGDPYRVPRVFDSYSALFWMDYTDEHVDGPPFDEGGKDNYPYLGWAEAHFHRWGPPTALAKHQYPLTWEAHASQARYEGMRVVCEEYVERSICSPHSWHAAEMLLYLVEGGK